MRRARPRRSRRATRRDGYPHELWTRLRAEAPVAYFAPPGYEPFWAITKHADILEISKQPLRFSSAQGITLRRAGAPVMPPSEMVVMLDPPQHGPVRRVANARFTPTAVRARRDDIERIAVEILDDAAPAGAPGELDFVERIAAPFPLAVIAWILGVPSDDWELLFRWTNEVIGKDDPEYRRPGETPGQTIKRARGEVHVYFRCGNAASAACSGIANPPSTSWPLSRVTTRPTTAPVSVSNRPVPENPFSIWCPCAARAISCSRSTVCPVISGSLIPRCCPPRIAVGSAGVSGHVQRGPQRRRPRRQRRVASNSSNARSPCSLGRHPCAVTVAGIGSPPAKLNRAITVRGSGPTTWAQVSTHRSPIHTPPPDGGRSGLP